MQYAEAIPAIRPDQQQCILTRGNLAKILLDIRRALDFMAIHFQNDVSRLQPSILSGTTRLYLFDHRSLHIVRRLDLVAGILSHIGQTQPPARFSVLAGVLADFFLAIIYVCQGYRNVDVFPVA